MFRLALLSSCLAAAAFAQGITVTGKNGKTVKIGAGSGGVEVQSGLKHVKVKGAEASVEADEGSDPDERPAATGPEVKGTTWVVNGKGRTETHACVANEDVVVNGQAHTLSLTGPCRNLVVNGQRQRITTEVAATITANGMRNTVTWKAAASGEKPSISISGLENTVTQAKD